MFGGNGRFFNQEAAAWEEADSCPRTPPESLLSREGF